ncbi:hypothetical protein EDB92DRAFT_1880937 [Lactarius akahatsu]|uniref:Uncharacterized protein n=1 Tax=Lactarius akahatsu TaxID=416441 RepID=A0AAD4QB37_9AGAM|nr:hypothetical protein EDB92DRAFT_1880937 [Lactarius akahatsu]
MLGLLRSGGCGHAFWTIPSPLSIFHDPNFALILIILCDLISTYAREHSVCFFLGRKGARGVGMIACIITHHGLNAPSSSR